MTAAEECSLIAAATAPGSSGVMNGRMRWPGVEYQRCFLARPAGIQTSPVTQRGAAPEPAPSGERPDGYPAHLTNGLIRNALGTPWKVVPMDEHRIGGALDPAILVQGVHWLTLRSLAPWTASPVLQCAAKPRGRKVTMGCPCR